MRCSLVLVGCCAILVSGDAQQPAPPSQIDKAVELLRQTPGVPPAPVAQPGIGLKITGPSNTAATVTAVTNQLSVSSEEKARELLRKLMATPQPASAAPVPAQPVQAQAARPPVQPPVGPAVRASNILAGISENPSATNQVTGEAEDKARALLRRYTNPQPSPAPQTVRAPAAPTPEPAPTVVQAPTPAPLAVPQQPEDAKTRAKNREAIRQKALSDARKIAEQQRTNERQLPELAAEQQRKTNADLERQRELQRIEMEVEKARLQREAKAKAEAAPSAIAQTPVAAPVTQAPVPAPMPEPVKPAPTVAQPAPAAPVVPTPVPQTAVVQTSPPQVQQPTPTPQPAQVPQPAQTVPVRPGTSTRFPGLAPDMEQRARDILNQVLATTDNPQMPSLAIKPAPSAVIEKPVAQPPPAQPAPTVAVTPPPAVAAPANLPSDKEAEARKLLEQTLSSLPRQPVPEAAKAKPETQKPIASRDLPTPAPAPIIASKPVAPSATPAELATDKEMQARQLLNQTLSSLPVQPVPADPKAKREVEKQARDVAKREVQMKAEAEAKARRQVLQLEEESRHRAQEEARRRIEMEKRAGQGSASSAPVHQETAPVVAAVKSPEPQPVKVQKAVATTPAEKKKNGNSKRDTQTPYADNPSASKEQRLSDLLQAYQRDEINAEQYHATRRKIISQ